MAGRLRIPRSEGGVAADHIDERPLADGRVGQGEVSCLGTAG